MHTIRIVSLALATLVFATAAQAQFSVPWFTVDGGGGTSAGGQLSVNGTIAQSDAGTLSGGGFKLQGGFWSGMRVVQIPGAPILRIKPIPGGLAMLSWPVSVSGFQLEQTADLGQPGGWSAVPQPVLDTGTEHTVTVPASAAHKCFRLKYVAP
jgi:hypothetical protein